MLDYTSSEASHDSKLIIYDMEEELNTLHMLRRHQQKDVDLESKVYDIKNNNDNNRIRTISEDAAITSIIHQYNELYEFACFALNTISPTSSPELFDDKTISAATLINFDKSNKNKNIENETERFISPELFMKQLPLQFKVNDPASIDSNNMNGNDDISRSESDLRQLKKDIERDQIYINGVKVVGAVDGGVNRIKQMLINTIKDVAMENHLNIDDALVSQAAIRALLAASRSNSGGLAFTSLIAKLDPIVRVLPLSEAARPLVIRVKAGAIRNDSSGKNINGNNGSSNNGSGWGIVIEASGSTTFQLFSDRSDLEELDHHNCTDVDDTVVSIKYLQTVGVPGYRDHSGDIRRKIGSTISQGDGDDSVEKKEHERRCGLVRNSLTSWLWSDDFGYSNNSNGSVDDRDQVLKEVIGERPMLQPIIPATATITIEAVKK